MIADEIEGHVDQIATQSRAISLHGYIGIVFRGLGMVAPLNRSCSNVPKASNQRQIQHEHELGVTVVLMLSPCPTDEVRRFHTHTIS